MDIKDDCNSNAPKTQILGDYQEKFPPQKHEFLIIGFSPSSLPIKKRWRNNGLSADFVTDYLTNYFPNSEQEQLNKMEVRIKDSVNYIANELLENAMKFYDNTSEEAINFALHLFEDYDLKVVLKVQNSITYKKFQKILSFIDDFLTIDPDEFYLLQLEKTVEGESENSSGIGLITIRNDYGAKLGWKFETVREEPLAIAVTTTVKLEYNLNGLF